MTCIFPSPDYGQLQNVLKSSYRPAALCNTLNILCLYFIGRKTPGMIFSHRVNGDMRRSNCECPLLKFNLMIFSF